MISGVHSSMVIVPRSGISTVRARISGVIAGRQVASVRRVPASRANAISIVGGG